MSLKQSLNVVIYPAPDLEGEWVAHCLELDMVSQGSSPPNALEMIAEAIEVTAQDNVQHGRPPLDFRAAPRDVWMKFAAADRSTAVDRILRFASGPLTDEVTITPYYRRAS